MSYIIQYNRQTQNLEFRNREPLDSSRLNMLFHRFGRSLANIIMEKRRRTQYTERLTGVEFNAIQYYSDIQYNELVTDIVFLHGIYRERRHHRVDFINAQSFIQWQEAIKTVDQVSILRALYSDNKISRSYFFKYVLNHPASLQGFAKYTLFINNTLGNNGQVEKIDRLPLPDSIKEDLKHSFTILE